MEKILIKRPDEHEAVEGDIYELHFSILSFPIISKIQTDAIIKKLNENPVYRIKDIVSNQGELIVTVTIVQNPFPLALAIGAVTTVLAGFFIWGSLDKVYKIVESPEGKILSIGTISAVIVGIIVLLSLLVRR